MSIDLKVGQVWTLAGNTNPSYTAIILKLETFGSEDIVHIAVLDENGEVYVEHMPFDLMAFANSINELRAKKIALPEFDEGYRYWKSHFLAGDAGVYDISVSEALGL